MSSPFIRFTMLLVLATACRLAEGSTINVRVADPTGVGIPKILVIVRSLEGKGEVARGLTDAEGLLSTPNVPAGLYRAIATDPYGPWFTRIKEFTAGDSTTQIDLVTSFAFVTEVPAGTCKLPVKVVDHDGQPVPEATIMARDLKAKFTFWAESDSHGRATVTVPMDGAQVVIVYRGHVQTEEVTVDSGLPACEARCWKRVAKRSGKTLRELTIRLP